MDDEEFMKEAYARALLLLRLRVFMCTLILLVNVVVSRECPNPPYKDAVKISELKIDDYLMLENPEKQFENRLERMDTANCFIFTLEKGNEVVGKLTKKDGFGLSKYGFKIGNQVGPLSIGSISEIVEFKLDVVKLSRRQIRKEVAEAGSSALILVLLGAVLIVVMGVIGAGMAGGK